MAKDKKGFILYADQQETFKQLTDEQAGKLIKHIYAYVNDEEPTSDDPLINMAFTPIRQQLKRDLNHWEDVRKKRSKAGKISANKRQQVLTSVESVQQKSTNPTVIVNDNVNETVIHIIENTAWKSAILKKYSLDDLQLKQLAEEFSLFADPTKDANEHRRHFANWINKQGTKTSKDFNPYG